MDILEIRNLIGEIEHKGLDNSAIETYLIQKKIPIIEWPHIMIEMYKITTRFSFFIIRYAHKAASTDIKFVRLLELIASIENGAHISVLMDRIVEENLDLATELYDKIKQSSNFYLKLYGCASLLRSIARRCPNIFYQEIIHNISTEDTVRKRSYILALYDLPPWRNTNMKHPKSILNFVYDCTHSKNIDLQRESINTCLVLLSFSKKQFLSRLKSFAMENDQNKLFLCSSIGNIDVNDNDFEFWIIDICAEVQSIEAMNTVCGILAHKLDKSKLDKKILQEKALEKIKKFSQRRDFLAIPVEGLVQEIAKANISYAVSFFEHWIREENGNTIRYFLLPRLICQLFRGHQTQLVRSIQTWIEKRNQQVVEVCMWILKELLREITYVCEPSMNPVYPLINRALEIAKGKGFDTKQTVEGFKRKEIDRRVRDCLSLSRSLNVNKNDELYLNITHIEKQMDDFLKDYAEKGTSVNLTYTILFGIAKKKGLDITRSSKNFDTQFLAEKVTRCEQIISSIEKKKKVIDYNSIKRNVKLFPNIRRFFGEWVNREDITYEHPFLLLLSEMTTSHEVLEQLRKAYDEETDTFKKSNSAKKISRYKYLQSILAHIDGCLENFTSTEQGTRFIRRLKEKENFDQTLSQLEVAAILKKRHKVLLEQKVNGSSVDILLTIDNRRFILENTSIDMLLKLKYSNAIIELGNKLKNTIRAKLEKQISKYPESISTPIVLIIDKSRSHETELEDLKQALFGSLAVVVNQDKENGQIAEGYLTRKHDSVGHEMVIAKRLSAVILYEQYFSEQDSTIRLKGYIIANPFASIKLDNEIINMLRYSLFGVSVRD